MLLRDRNRRVELALVVDKKVLRFEIAMEDTIFVAEGNTLKELVHERLDGHIIELAALTARVHEFLEIFVHIFEDKHEFVFGMDDVVEGDNVLVLELFHEGDFADGGGGGAFFAVEVDFFEGDEFAGLAVAALENGCIGAFA